MEVGEIGTSGVFCFFRTIRSRLVEVIGAGSVTEAEISRVLGWVFSGGVGREAIDIQGPGRLRVDFFGDRSKGAMASSFWVDDREEREQESRRAGGTKRRGRLLRCGWNRAGPRTRQRGPGRKNRRTTATSARPACARATWTKSLLQDKLTPIGLVGGSKGVLNRGRSARPSRSNSTHNSRKSRKRWYLGSKRLTTPSECRDRFSGSFRVA